MSKAYSFLNTQCTIVGPGGSFSLGYGAGVAEEGITIEMAGDKNTMTVGADGTPMHSLHADKSGTATVRLLKTSPVNQQLMQMYDLQTTDASLHGQNLIRLSNTAAGDVTSCRAVAFKKKPSNVYAKDGGMNEWIFDCGAVDTLLGNYN